MKASSIVLCMTLIVSTAHTQLSAKAHAKRPLQPSTLPYTNDQIIRYAKSVDVHTLDPSLSSQHLEDWLTYGPPHVDSVRWIADDTCDIKPGGDIDYPLCARVEFGRGQQWGYFLVLLGTLKKGVVGPPRLYEGVEVWEEAFVQTGGTDRLSGIPDLLDQPVVTQEASKLYEKVAERHPIGIPKGPDKAALSPFLSNRMIHQLEGAQACEDDYLHQQSKATSLSKPGWMTRDLFSGENDRAASFFVNTVHKEPRKDGSFDVTLDVNERNITGKNDSIIAGGIRAYSVKKDWPVIATVVSQNGRYLVDDVRIYESRDTTGPSPLLSESFTGCDGPRWVGLPAAAQ